MLSIRAIRYLSIIGGILLPLGELVRRFGHLTSWWMWFDDVLIGLALLSGAWLSRKLDQAGLRALSAAWGVAAGMGYYSFADHLVQMGHRDVSGMSGVAITSVIGALWVISLYCAVASIVAVRKS